MSLTNDRSPHVTSLDDAVETYRHGTPMPLSPDADAAAFAATLGDGGALASVVRLTARHPWFDGLAAMYAFDCSRWDSPAELVYCLPNQQPEGSGWDGTVLYIDFTAPEPGNYAIVAAVHGPNSVVHLRGPWGTIQKAMPAGQDHQLVGVSWSGSDELTFTLTFSGQWLGAISEVQIFERG